MGETDKPIGYIEKTITFIVPTHVGDRFLEKKLFDFHETKDGKVVVVKEKHEDKKA